MKYHRFPSSRQNFRVTSRIARSLSLSLSLMDPFSFPQRVVLLIDLHPLLLHPNPNPDLYIASIIASVKKLLSFPPLSSSLFAFSLFFSSLSPVLSESKLRPLLARSTSLLSFDRPSQTLYSLSKTLHSASLVVPADPVPTPDLASMARFLLRLEHDYSWDPATAATPQGNPNTIAVRPNLVLLFSSMCPEHSECNEFLDQFHKVFGPVSEKFASRDMHFSWVDVNFDGHCEKERLGLGFLEKGIREFGWGFFSTDAILLGSALVPFGLLFPYIGCTMGFRADDNVKKGQAELVLGIIDVSGEALECKICDLEVVDLKMIIQRSDFWDLFSNNSDGKMKLCVRKVWRNDEEAHFLEKSCGVVLLRGKCGKDPVEFSPKAFFADRVLQLLSTEKGEILEGKPIWQLLLDFLFRKNYWALVSLSCSDGKSVEGIIKPFTVNHALLSIVAKNSLCAYEVPAKDLVDKRKRNKLHKVLLHDATWSSFYKAVITQDNYVAPDRDLCELYFAMECNSSKKLRFLKCWTRQIQKSSAWFQFKSPEQEVPLIVSEEVKRVVEAQKDPEEHVPSSPARERHLSRDTNAKPFSFSCLEDVDAFIGSIPQKIEHGLCSEEVDLWNLAGRLVALCVNAIYFKSERTSMDDQISKEAKKGYDSIAAEVSHLLFVKPKDLTLKYKSFSSATMTSDQHKVAYSTENKIREHELQILFRMEMLKLGLVANLEENMERKVVKEICSLLQNIEFSLQGDSFSGESLLEFAGRTIKSRYSQCLGDIIQKIYEHMEFFSFDGDEVDASDSLPGSNSEEPHRDGDEKDIASGAITKGLHSHEVMLMQAHKRRDRARRFASFTSWVPDLHRVWAFKQPRAEKSVHESLPKSKSKKRKRRESRSEMVCETPMTGKKHLQVQEDNSGDPEATSSNSRPCKALFQPEGMA